MGKKYHLLVLILLIIFQYLSSSTLYLKKVSLINSDSLVDTVLIVKKSNTVFLPEKIILSDSTVDSVIYYHQIIFDWQGLDTTIVESNTDVMTYNEDEFDDIFIAVARDSIYTDSTYSDTTRIQTSYYIPGQEFQGIDTIKVLSIDSIQNTPFKAAISCLGKGIYQTNILDNHSYYLTKINYQEIDSLIEDVIMNPPKINKVKEDNEFYSLKVYPNPAQDILEIDCSCKNLQKIDLALYNMFGAELFVTSLKEVSNRHFQIDVSKYNSQLYYLKVTSNGNAESKIFPIIIIH